MATAALVVVGIVAAWDLANPPRRLGEIDAGSARPGTAEPAPEQRPGAEAQLVTAAVVPSVLTSMAANPDTGSMYVASIDGRVQLVRRVEEDAGVVPRMQPDPMLDLGDEIQLEGERGLLGLAVSPDGRHLYVSFTDAAADGAVRIDELALEGDEVDLASRRTLLSVPHPTPFHNGGSLALDDDGLLWIGLGDGGYVPDGPTYSYNAEDPDVLLGKLLRIDPTASATAPYTIPPDNPFAAGAGGRPEIWATGLRNPWRIGFDSETGDLWIADVGSASGEEIDRLVATDGLGRGANLGWNVREGDRPNTDAREGQAMGPPYFEPVHTYDHSDGRCAVIGGALYRGRRLPDLDGAFVYADLCDGVVRTLRSDGEASFTDEALDDLVIPGQPTGIFPGPEGELYATTLDGHLYRFDPAD